MSTRNLLTLVQWLSPSFPTGAYAYGQGLEAAISAGDIGSAATCRDWLAAVLRHGSGLTDAVLVCHAMAPDADLGALADLADALAPGAERLRETREMGHAFARTVSALTGQTLPPLPYPVAVGVAARGLGLDRELVATLYLAAFAANLVQVAVRFVPLGQTEGQGILADLHPVIETTVRHAAELDLHDIGSATLRADLASLSHETMETRIFRT